MKSFVEITDVRDGLYPSLRYALAQMQKISDENDGKYRRASKIIDTVTAELLIGEEELYDSLIDATWPRCEIPFVDGHGNMGFPPAGPYFSEMRVSNYYRMSNKTNSSDCNLPLAVPVPCVLSNGTFGREKGKTEIPSHNLAEVSDAAIALLRNPDLETKDLIQYIKGPDLLLGGEILNKNALCDIYEKGQGVFEVMVTPENFNNRFFDYISDYCGWYYYKFRKMPLKDKWKVHIPYNALLFDGETTKYMSLKEIIQKHLEYYKSVKEDITDDALCEKLEEFKRSSSKRITKA